MPMPRSATALLFLLLGGSAIAAPPAATPGKTAPPRKLVQSAAPVYPAAAKEKSLSGSVTLELTIGKGGDVSAVRVLKGEEPFASSATDAAKKWRYEPSDLGPTKATITLNFVPERPKPRTEEKK